MATKSSTFSSVISRSPMITLEKLEADIPEVDRVQWRKIDAQLCSVLWQSSDPKILLHLRASKTCFKFWNRAKGLYTNDIQRLYKVASSIVNVRQQDMDLSTYIGQIASLKEEFLTVMPLTTDVGDQRTQIDKFFMVLMLIGLCPDLETVRYQILGNSSVPSLDDMFARLLRISSTRPLPSDNTPDSSVLVSQTNSRGGRSGNRGRGQRPHCTYCNKLGHTRDRCYQLHGRPPRTAHMAQSSDPQSPQPPSSSTSQGIFLTDNEYDDYLRYQATKSASVAQTGNVSACLTHTSFLGPWILDSGASDHISGNKDFFSSITTTSALPTVTLANGSQTMAKGFGFAHPLHSVLYAPECPFNLISISKITRTLNCSIIFSDKFVTLQDRSTGKTIGIGRESQGLYHLTSPSTPAICISTDAPLLIHSRLCHPSLSKFQKMVPRFSSLSSLACESCQLGKHTRVSFPKRLNNRAKSPFELVHTDVWGPCRTASTLGFQYFVTFIDDYSRSQSRRLFSSTVATSPARNKVPSRPLQVYHRRHRVAVPPSLAEVPADSLPIPSASRAPALPPSADLLIALKKSTSEALSHPGWRQAMVDEMAALHSNDTWDLVVLPSGKSTVGCRWVYTVKVSLDGQVDRLKARLVVKGYTQVYGSDYGDTFSFVAKITSIRLLLSMAAMRSWPLYQLDIKNDFLHGDLVEEVYMEQPPDFVAQGESGLVCRLRRSLYGLKQFPRAWFSRFSSVVQEFGMFRSTANHSVFDHHNSSGQCISLIVYVDDIVITGSDQNGIQKLKQHLFTHFQTKDFGKLKYFLGIEIAQSSSGVVISQRKYALDILEETGMFDCKPVDTPMDPNVKLIPGQGEPLGDPRRYRRLVGKLNYLTITRPDISFPSKKQDVVARSSAEAEYRAMALATCELIWLKHLLRELRFGKDEQMKLICDNQAALHIASNPVFHKRTKHIEVDRHFIRENIASGCVATSFVNSNDQLADIFTKSLKGPRIKYICNKFGAYNIYAPA
ncbi:Retrovirus-related Pol polyprotein from transposon RE1 [Vitis vinifera]|uniref:Retrovirus-related Pol polyprotein from transposon RE1 n=1 Tax=Vitis vinifera TaxID=29760 RepID=A0A438HG10_VITVI|nr:Retrovirus-related Pol polyprotein from transposon RE1 [Vitis vinifera]